MNKIPYDFLLSKFFIEQIPYDFLLPKIFIEQIPAAKIFSESWREKNDMEKFSERRGEAFGVRRKPRNGVEKKKRYGILFPTAWGKKNDMKFCSERRGENFSDRRNVPHGVGNFFPFAESFGTAWGTFFLSPKGSPKKKLSKFHLPKSSERRGEKKMIWNFVVENFFGANSIGIFGG